MNAENAPRLLNSGDSYEEDLKTMIWKTSSQFSHFPPNISSSFGRIKLHTENQPPSSFNSVESY